MEEALLQITGDIQRMSASCADIYIQSVNMSGLWLQEAGEGEMHFNARRGAIRKGWINIKRVQVKVIRGITMTGIPYLNMFTKNLGNTRLRVGGILGEDDHTIAATPTEDCRKSIVL